MIMYVCTHVGMHASLHTCTHGKLARSEASQRTDVMVICPGSLTRRSLIVRIYVIHIHTHTHIYIYMHVP